MNRVVLRAAASVFAAFAFSALAQAQQFHIGLAEVSQTGGGANGALAYFGPNFGSGDRRGIVLDGGSDAYDDAGVYFEAFPAGLSLTRRTTTLPALNIFRWIDTFTNRSAEPLVVSLNFSSNLGSDGGSTVLVADPFRTVSFDRSPSSTDPVIGAMHGNNPLAASLINASLDFGNLNRRFTLSLAPNQSIALAFADFLARDLTDRSGDQVLVLARTAELLADPTPLFADISPEAASRIANWTIPAPSTGAAAAILALAGLARRRRA